MSNNLKTHLRDLLPKRYQVPAKYWYGKLHGTLEAEMKLLDSIVRIHDKEKWLRKSAQRYKWKLRA